MKKIQTVGVVGAGTMGAAIAQKFAQQGFKVILADREMKYITKGIASIREMLEQGAARRLFRPEQIDIFIANIKGTADLNELKQCDLIVEAIYENFNAKSELFKKLDTIVSKDTILATNTSSFSVSELAKSVSYPERFIGLHYFYHAAKNRLVEIIPGKETSDEVYKALQFFSVRSGKDAIKTADVFGFAVNRFFVPWLNEAVRILEEKTCSISQIDKICMKIFSIGMGPFALMNATGVPIAYHAQKTLEVFGNAYKTCELLKKQAESGKEWELGDLENTKIDSEIMKIVSERMKGIVFFVCSQILSENICTAVELNRGARIGLRWRKGPVDLMQKEGEEEVTRLAKNIATYYGEQVPKDIKTEKWNMEYVTLTKSENRAIVTMSRPEDMNALNETVMKQLDNKFTEAENDKKIDTIFITGTGKAFVAGADIRFFVKNIRAKTLDNIVNFTAFGQHVFEKIDKSKKNVVAVINGLVLGGGLELALCADVILTTPSVIAAFPETGIGIYPGLGGTQRTVRRIGKGLSKFMIYTGQMLNSKKALQMGLIDAVVTYDKIFDILSGKEIVPNRNENKTTKEWKAIGNFFDNFTVEELLNGVSENDYIAKENAEKFSKKIKYKAPIALKTAEKLIDEAAGCKSELDKLKMIFSTEDAILGLSSIGKRMSFKGK